jgi:Ubiquitin carboxyl-terminal hydrolase
VLHTDTSKCITKRHRLLIEALEKSLKHTSGENLCESLYKGLIVNQIRCLKCKNLSEREEHFYDINVQVIGCEHLSSSLRQYCSAELLEGESAYQCDYCSSKQRAQRSTVLRDLPPILTFSCNRFKIDKSTNWQRQKVTSKSAFPLLLDMGRFVEGSEGTAEAVMEGSAEESYQKVLHTSMVWVDEVVKKAEDIAGRMADKYGKDVTFQVLSDAEKEEVSIALRSAKSTPHASPSRSSNSSSNSNSNSSSNSSSGVDKSYLYELFAVIMHRGSAHSGHYFAYIRDTLQEGVWALPESHYKNKSDYSRIRARRKARADAAQSREGQQGLGQEEKLRVSQASTVGSAASDDISSSALSLAEAPSDLMFVRASGGLIFIEETSVLGTLSNIVMRAKAEQVERERKIAFKAKKKANAKARSHDKDNDKDRVDADAEAVLCDSFSTHAAIGSGCQAEVEVEVPSVDIKHINDLISLRLGRGSWNSLYEREHGTVEGFVAQYGSIFELDKVSGQLSLPNYGSLNWVSREVLVEVFRAEARISWEASLEAAHSAAAAAGVTAGGRSSSIPPTAHAAAGSSTLLNCDNDAALAHALQLSLNESNGSTSARGEWAGCGTGGESVLSATSESVDDEWVTATQKKKSVKGKVKGKDSMKSDISAGPSTGEQDLGSADSTADPDDDLCAAEKALTEDLLCRHHGRYFEFNDSSVAAMPLSGLERAFEGKDSAYILVYRKVRDEVKAGCEGGAGKAADPGLVTESLSSYAPQAPLDSNAITSPRLTGGVCGEEDDDDASPSTSRSIVGIGSTVPPPYWADKIVLENGKIEEERSQYNSKVHTALIRFLAPVHVTFLDPLLLPKGSQATTGPSSNSCSNSNSSSNSSVPSKYQEHIELTLDLRMSIAEAREAFVTACAPFLTSLKIDLDNASGSSSSSSSNSVAPRDSAVNSSSNSSSSSSSSRAKGRAPDVCISALSPFGDGFHPDLPLAPDTVLGDVIGIAATFLVWNGRSVGTN